MLALLLAMPSIAMGTVWTITGAVTDASSSRAVPGAWVSAYFWNAMDAGFEYYDEAQTGTNGLYELNYRGWQSTDCEVQATAMRYGDSYASLSFDAVSSLVKDFALQPNRLAFQGTISDATTAKAIGGAAVSAYFYNPIDDMEYWDEEKSAADGSYHLYPGPAATYEVCASAYRYYDVSEGVVFDGTSVVSKDLALRRRTPSFKGTVTDTETAQGIRAQVSSLFTDGDGQQYWDEVTTTADGAYELYPCGPAGEYKIWVSAPLYARTAATAYFDGAKTVSQDFGMLTINRPPTAVGDSLVLDEDSSIRAPYPSVLANDWDINHDSLTAERVTGPSHGWLSLYPDGTYYYSPYVNFFGSDVFTYRAKDPAGRYSPPVEVRIQVTGVNDAPVAADDDVVSSENVAINRGQAAGVLANDSDVDSLALTAEVVFAPLHGTLALRADGSYTYSPVATYCGVDRFSYRAKDSEGLYSAPATVTITLKRVTATLLRITSTSGLLADWTAPYVMTGKLNTLPSGAAVSRRRVYAQIATSKNGPFKDTSWAGLTTPNGSFRFPVYFSGRAYLRVVFAGDDLRASTPSGSSSYLPSQSGTVVRSTKPAGVGNPIAPCTMRVGRYAKVYGDLYPHHTAGQNVVRIYRYRLVKGKWRNYGFANAKSIVYWPQTRYVAPVKLPYRGRWRLRTYHPADSMRPGRWSDGSDFVTVR